MAETIQPKRKRIKTVAAEYSISRSTLYRRARRGLIEIVLDGGISYVMMDSLERYLANLPRKGDSTDRLVEGKRRKADSAELAELGLD